MLRNIYLQEFPGCPMVRTPSFHCLGLGLIPGWETILEAEGWGHKKKKKKYLPSGSLKYYYILEQFRFAAKRAQRAPVHALPSFPERECLT